MLDNAANLSKWLSLYHGMGQNLQAALQHIPIAIEF